MNNHWPMELYMKRKRHAKSNWKSSTMINNNESLCATQRSIERQRERKRLRKLAGKEVKCVQKEKDITRNVKQTVRIVFISLSFSRYSTTQALQFIVMLFALALAIRAHCYLFYLLLLLRHSSQFRVIHSLSIFLSFSLSKRFIVLTNTKNNRVQLKFASKSCTARLVCTCISEHHEDTIGTKAVTAAVVLVLRIYVVVRPKKTKAKHGRKEQKRENSVDS